MVLQNTNWDEQLESLRQELAYLQEQINLIERLQSLAEKRTGTAQISIVGQAAQTGTQKAGRPAGNVKKAPVESVTQQAKRRGRPKGSGSSVAKQNEQKNVPLHILIETIAQSKGKPFDLAELVNAVCESGYQSKGNLSSMVYQSLRKLVKQDKIVKNEDRLYQHKSSEAA